MEVSMACSRPMIVILFRKRGPTYAGFSDNLLSPFLLQIVAIFVLSTQAIEKHSQVLTNNGCRKLTQLTRLTQPVRFIL